MELVIRIQIEELPEGLYLATSDELPGLLAQGLTVAEALDTARDLARRDKGGDRRAVRRCESLGKAIVTVGLSPILSS